MLASWLDDCWTSFFLWLQRGWVAIDLSVVATSLSSFVIFAIGACGVALGCWLRGHWMKTFALSETSIAVSRVGPRNFAGVYTDRWTSTQRTIEISYGITWKDGKQDRWAHGEVNTKGELSVRFKERGKMIVGTLKDDDIHWSNGAFWRREH